MKELKLTAMTMKGEYVMRKLVAEDNLENARIQKLFKTLGFKRVVLSEVPFVVKYEITNKVFQSIISVSDMENMVSKRMEDAVLGRDYTIEVK